MFSASTARGLKKQLLSVREHMAPTIASHLDPKDPELYELTTEQLAHVFMNQVRVQYLYVHVLWLISPLSQRSRNYGGLGHMHTSDGKAPKQLFASVAEQWLDAISKELAIK